MEMDNVTFGVTMLVAGMGGTLVTLASTVTATGTGVRTGGYSPNAWEGCMSCHGPDRGADIKKVHMK